jgi:hypothetical protein
MLKEGFLDEEICIFLELLDLLRATVPGHQQRGFLTEIVGLFVATCTPLVAKCMRGAFPPVDLRAVCLVQAMVLYVYGRGCLF